MISDNAGMVQEMNKFFASVFTVEGAPCYPKVSIKKVIDQSLNSNDLFISEELILKELNELKMNKSPGENELNSTYLKKVALSIVRPLMFLYSESINLCIVPEDWKRANVTPLFKKGKKSDVNNYRPVSLTSQLCKILEKIIKRHIDQYLNLNDLISNSQHGFRDGKSCLTNLLQLNDYVTRLLDENIPVDILYLDFSKAFDKVPHQGLMLKLRAYGLDGKILNWIESWLTDRFQRVCYGGVSSDWVRVTSGVPQGSVLGPLLFVLFIDDLESGLSGKVLKFADDTKLVSRVSNVREINEAKSDLDKLMNWSSAWKMPFNVDKCKVMHVGNRNPKCKFELGGKMLIEVIEESDLGVVYTDTFKQGMQCANASKSANKIAGLIYRTISSRSVEVMLPLYKALVRPKLEYCIQAWKPFLKKDVLLLEKVQKRFTKNIKGCRGLSYEERLSKLDLISIEKRILRADLVLTYKIITGKGYKDLKYMFKNSCYTSTRGNKLKLQKNRCRLDIRYHSFCNRVVDCWNKLPDAVVVAESVEIFKGGIAHYQSACGGPV